MYDLSKAVLSSRVSPVSACLSASFLSRDFWTKSGIFPSKTKPLFLRASTTSIISMPLTMAPFGMVITRPIVFSFVLFVISLKPRLSIICTSSGYSVHSSYTLFFKSILFSMFSFLYDKHIFLEWF